MLSTEVYDFMRQENYIFMNIHLFWKQLLMCSKCSMQCNEMYQCNKMRQWNVWHSPNYECQTKSRSSAAVNILRALCQTLHFSFLLSWKNKPKSFVKHMTEQKPSEKYEPKIDSGRRGWSCIALCSVRCGGWGREKPCVSGEVTGHRNTHSRSRGHLI